jgi:hypothetical protein
MHPGEIGAWDGEAEGPAARGDQGLVEAQETVVVERRRFRRCVESLYAEAQFQLDVLRLIK